MRQRFVAVVLLLSCGFAVQQACRPDGRDAGERPPLPAPPIRYRLTPAPTPELPGVVRVYLAFPGGSRRSTAS